MRRFAPFAPGGSIALGRFCGAHVRPPRCVASRRFPPRGRSSWRGAAAITYDPPDASLRAASPRGGDRLGAALRRSFSFAYAKSRKDRAQQIVCAEFAGNRPERRLRAAQFLGEELERRRRSVEVMRCRCEPRLGIAQGDEMALE